MVTRKELDHYERQARVGGNLPKSVCFRLIDALREVLDAPGAAATAPGADATSPDPSEAR